MLATMSRPPVLKLATQPLVAGDTLDNPATGESGVIVKGPWEGEDRSFEGKLTVQPGGAVIGEHVHHNFDERFSVAAGEITFRLDGSESVAGPGDVVEIPSGHWHDWWNAGAEEAIVMAYVSEGDRFLQMIETIWGLARDGHTNSKGLPDPLQLAMFATEFRDVLVLRRPPAVVQSVLFGLLQPIAKARGYRGTYPQYGRSLLAAE